MKHARTTNNRGFWLNMAISAVMLTGVAALAWAAPVMYTTRLGHFPATMISLMRSRALLYNPGVTGYYERLFGGRYPMFVSGKEFDAWSKEAPDVIYERSFRIRRYRPNLHGFHHRSQPQGLTTNSFGLVGPETSLRKPPLTRRVALLGDSLSQGWGSDQNRSYVRVLESRLNAAHPDGISQRFEILNFSVGGYDLTQMLDVAEEDVPRFEPDVYLLALTEQGAFRNWAEHFTWMIRLGIDPKYDFLRKTVRESRVSGSDSALAIFGDLAPFRIPVLRTIFERIQARAARDHAPFIVLFVPSLEDGDMNQKRFAGMRELLAGLHIPVVDLLDTFNGFLSVESFRTNPLDVHPNPQGHRMIAENLYAKLQARPDLWGALAGQASSPVLQMPSGSRSGVR